MTSNKKIIILLGIILLTLVLASIFLLSISKTPSKKLSYQTLKFVEEKISQSGYIKINLPNNINFDYAKSNIIFEPPIKGRWVNNNSSSFLFNQVFAQNDVQSKNQLIYKPFNKLEINKHYSVILKLDDGSSIKGEFLAVEDPKIEAIFPKDKSETSEYSEITVVFNRPMIPLSILNESEVKDVPIEIFPETEGRFKLISTRNLQFIPKTRLIRSSNYKVKIKEGLVSMDGLSVKGTESSFVSKKLRLLNSSHNNLLYNKPFLLSFNQPIDLEKTKKEIKLTDLKTNREIPFIAEYPSLTEFNEFKIQQQSFFDKVMALAGNFIGVTSKNKTEILKEKRESVLYIYPFSDSFNRAKLWDFDRSYQLEIATVYPQEGDITLSDLKFSFFINGIIESISADSLRAKDFVSQDLFDPQGKLVVRFMEDIDWQKSAIKSSKPIKNISYGKKCQNDENMVDSSEDGSGCLLVEDKRQINIEFFEQDFSTGETFDIVFDKIVSLSGLKLNTSPIIKNIKVYPRFEVFSTLPKNNAIDASLTKLIICSSTPIFSPKKEDFPKFISANHSIEIKQWHNSWKAINSERCGVNQFETEISYGLMPLEKYEINLNLKDVFDQAQSVNISFTTRDIDKESLRFFHLQKYYNVTTPQKPSLTFAVQNMDFINVDICKTDAENFLRYLKSRLFGGDANISSDERTVFNCLQKISKRISLPKKYWVNNYFQVNLKDYFPELLGHYILTFSHPDYKVERERWDYTQRRYVKYEVYERSYLTVTDLSVVAKEVFPKTVFFSSGEPVNEKDIQNMKNLYWVTSSTTLQGLPNAEINLYNESIDVVSKIFTNSQGIATLTPNKDLYAAIVKYKNDSSIIFKDETALNYVPQDFATKRIYIYTDKPIYQPGQTVYVKGIHRIGFQGHYEIDKDQKVRIRLYDPKYQEVSLKELSLNKFGTFNTEFILDSKSPLGSYSICADNGDCYYFDVEEYVGAAFELKFKSQKPEYVSKENIRLTVDANYYFGLPLEGGKIDYTFSSQNYYFDKLDSKEYYFGNNTYHYADYYYGDKFLFSSSDLLNDQGKTVLDRKLDLKELIQDRDQRQSKIIIVDATVQNPQGQSVSSQTSFILHQGKFYLGISPNKTFLAKNEPLELKIKSVDLEGKGVSVKNINLLINKVEWIYAKRQEADGGYSYKTEKKITEVNRYNFSTDSSGDYDLKNIQIAKEGEYEVEVLATDDMNNEVWSKINLYVFGENQASVRPFADTTLEIEAKEKKLNVGQKGQIIIKSPYQNSKALIAIERGKIFSYEIIDLKGNFHLYSFDVLEQYYPNIFVSVLLISNAPDVKFNFVEFTINSDSKKINIEIKSNKTHYLPGEKVILDITTKDSNNQPVQAELSVAVVDLSILALKGNPPKNPLVFFYDGFPLAVQTSANLKNVLVESEIDTKGGGGAEGDLSKKQRGEFKETAFWKADVVSDQQGKAQVSFTLPDNLTTWQIESIGVTQDTKLGITYSNFIAKKDLMVVPLKPRFIVPGDIFYVGAKIFNQTKTVSRIKVEFESETLDLVKDEKVKLITIPAEKTDTLYFKVRSPENIDKGIHKFILKASVNDQKDEVVQSISITPNETYEIVATNGYSAKNIEKEFIYIPDYVLKEKGNLTINSSATLALFLSPALNYLISFPYGCLEQIASTLKSIVKIKQGLSLPNLQDKFTFDLIKYQDKNYTVDDVEKILLDQLLASQSYDGGFPFWKGQNSNFNATLAVFETLLEINDAGYFINKQVLLKTADYLLNEFNRHTFLFQNPNTTIILGYLLSRLPEFTKGESLKQTVLQYLDNALLIKEKLSNLTLSYLSLALINWNVPENKRQIVYQILDNRLKIDSRGAFIDSNSNNLWYYFETPIKNTAMYLKTLVARKYDSPVINNILRWLLKSRSKDGSWGSTNNSLFVIDALIDFISWKKETQSDFDLKILLNNKEIQKATFNAKNILDQFVTTLSLEDLKIGQNNVIAFHKQDNNNLKNGFYYDMALKYYLPAEYVLSRDEGFSVERRFYRLDDKGNTEPILKAKVGDIIKVHLKFTTPKHRNYVSIEDFIPAGTEIVNLDLSTEQKSLRLIEKENFGNSFYADFKEIRNDRAYFFKNYLAAGTYEIEYFIRALIKGKFLVLPAMVNETYFPENFGRSEVYFFEVE